MDAKNIRRLKKEAQALKVTLHVGKDGVTEELATELTRQLKKSGLVKVRLRPSVETDRDEAGRELAQVSSSTLVEVRGRTAVLSR
ncbi:MAG: YhbY family RNA-binding protein [Candidatus Thermoplasmatota archaeon]|nr:YhbY family RNA-binding protein [Candidatus Thermoplasmatota archaeon]